MSICIVDYGVGNIHSAMKALRRFHDDVVLTEDPERIRTAEGIVLPGVGAFAAGMEGLRVRGLVHTVRDAAAAGRHILGICLGAQLLLSTGHEFGDHEGLGIIPGIVKHFPALSDGCKVPHMGWNAVLPAPGAAWNGTLLEGTKPGTLAYFVHSYVMQPADAAHTLAVSEYGGCTFASVVASGNVIGCQFHPEKSAEGGLAIIGAFARRCTGAT